MSWQKITSTCFNFIDIYFKHKTQNSAIRNSKLKVKREKNQYRKLLYINTVNCALFLQTFLKV